MTERSPIRIPRAFADLLRPEHRRYRVYYGGRGSGKSWSIARALVALSASRPIRILCARELQASIADSVHRLLSDQIAAMALVDQFAIQKTSITSASGSEFLFKGLRHNVAEIKSLEGVDICWVEEAALVSEESWELLIPTIRKVNSEIWISFNPRDATDPTYQRFVESPPPGALVRKVNFGENPHFPSTLLAEMEHQRRTDPDAYAHIWLGEPRKISDDQVLRGRWRIDTFEPKPDWDGPYFGADWGFSSDPSALVKCWISGRTLYIEREAYGIGVELDELPDLFRSVPGADQHIIRADNSRPETISHMRARGLNVVAADKWPGSVQDGIAALRGFNIVIHPRCRHAEEEARLWRYKTDRLTGDVLPILLDGHDHIWDSVRYALQPIIRNRSDPAGSTVGTADQIRESMRPAMGRSRAGLGTSIRAGFR